MKFCLVTPETVKTGVTLASVEGGIVGINFGKDLVVENIGIMPDVPYRRERCGKREKGSGGGGRQVTDYLLCTVVAIGSGVGRHLAKKKQGRKGVLDIKVINERNKKQTHPVEGTSQTSRGHSWIERNQTQKKTFPGRCQVRRLPPSQRR